MSRYTAALLALPLLFAGPILSSPLYAQNAPDPYAACAAMAEDAARLTCFDTTHARLQQSAAARAQQAQERRTEEFGFSEQDLRAQRERDAAVDTQAAERLAQMDEESARESDAAITGTVAEVLTDGAKRTVVRLDNGQFWRETDGSTMRNRVRDGWHVSVTRHWSGAYEMRFEERGGYLRVTRIR